MPINDPKKFTWGAGDVVWDDEPDEPDEPAGPEVPRPPADLRPSGRFPGTGARNVDRTKAARARNTPPAQRDG